MKTPEDLTHCQASRQTDMALLFKKARRSCKLPSLIVMLLVFLCVCSAIFSQLESDHDKTLYHKYQGQKLYYLKKYNMTEKELHSLMMELSYMKKKGFASAYKNYWGFYHSFWFSITVITTMGFGHIVPETFSGRLFCIVCALLGIPLNLLVLKNVGQTISRLITNIICKVEWSLRRVESPKHQNVKCAVVSFSLMVAVILIGGGLDTIFDGWTFFDGVYFNFIALSTIGFGDLFPRVETATKLDRLGLGDDGKRVFASTVMMVYMIIGLSITSTVILSILNAIEEVSHIEVRWIRNGSVHAIMSLRKLRTSKGNIAGTGGQRQDIVITPAFEDISETYTDRSADV
ncbi:hypothetical protein QZH41_018737, partial [Actinostola sp. cb2023]